MFEQFQRMFEQFQRTMRSGVKLLLFILLSSQAMGCGIFENEEDIADNARVVISGSTPVPLLLVTSTRFQRSVGQGGQPLVLPIQADTVELDLTSVHDQIYPVKPDKGFLARLINPSEETATVSMQVYFDGRLNYDQQNVSLTDSSMEFSYTFEGFN